MNPVTILIGFKTKHGVLLASDSQTTYGTEKRLNARKILPVTFKDGHSGLVAQAGNVTTGGAAVDLLAMLCSQSPVENEHSFGYLAETAVRALRDKMRDQQGGCTHEKLNQFIRNEGLDCELMLASFVNQKPQIFTINLLVGISAMERSQLSVLGCGGSLASFLLRDTEHLAENGFGETMCIALSAIEKVKQFDAFCGGPARIGYLGGNGKVIIPEDLWIETVASEINNLDKEDKVNRIKRVEDMLTLMQNVSDDFENEVNAEQEAEERSKINPPQ